MSVADPYQALVDAISAAEIEVKNIVNQLNAEIAAKDARIADLERQLKREDILNDPANG